MHAGNAEHDFDAIGFEQIDESFADGLHFGAHARRSFRALHDSLNRSRFKDKIMQRLKVLQRPLRA
ncbi:hypothetical protein GHK48_21890 [Sinorhizobium fredii]|uniref:Uncharacterized protein n=1 Tax=Rhizobium fredii TaxID=380 RepID=A0A844AFP2_RHIFR|nr:hypothetical protein [Sinorhizobium fredii]MQX10848.1 hypothetical protein [Sinorhizobium fredii]